MEYSELELGPKELGFVLEPGLLERVFGAADEPGLAGADDAAPTERRPGFIGQPRALEALRLGIGIQAKGYNIYVSGAPGTGRRSVVLRSLEDIAFEPGRLRDLAYVYNFGSALEPLCLTFPAGEARVFKRGLHDFVEAVKKLVRLQAESASVKQSEAAKIAAVESRENSLLAAFEAQLAADGFRAVQVDSDKGEQAMDIVLLRDTEGGTGEDGFEQLEAAVARGEFAAEEYDRLRERWYSHMDRMKKLFAELRQARAGLEQRLRLERDEELSPQIAAEAELLAGKYARDKKTKTWIESLRRDVLTHLYLFRGRHRDSSERSGRTPGLARYGVNIVVDQSGLERLPVIVENNPTVPNLFGSIEQRPDKEGDNKNAYLLIRPGSLLRASGGFLVLKAEDVLADEEAWARLKHALTDCRVEIQGREGPAGFSGWLKPEAAEARVKVIMIGGESSYDLLYQADPDFQTLFKVHAEFDSSMDLDEQSLRGYAAFARGLCEREGLLPLSAGGFSALAEQGARIAEYRSRLSTRFGTLADIIREADFRARQAGSELLDERDVNKAIDARSRLSDMPEEKFGQMIASGEIILQASGLALGRVNGLAIHDRGYYAFGIPAVISAQVSPGEGGVINIEGESGLSGEIYDKAVLIVEGFLRSRYARDFPLAVTASICFEQSYTAVEGDSASSTAVYALLSAIAEIGLRQDVAVTGSVNQIGQIQPVGGVNEKIEGFYRVCRQTGLSGSQGVMIPRRNVVNLSLSRELRQAVEQGRFHIWAVSTIDQGIEVLTGMQAGMPDAKGEFPPESFNGRVRRQLLRMAKTVKSYLN